jgi:hypothetical protein
MKSAMTVMGSVPLRSAEVARAEGSAASPCLSLAHGKESPEEVSELYVGDHPKAASRAGQGRANLGALPAGIGLAAT